MSYRPAPKIRAGLWLMLPILIGIFFASSFFGSSGYEKVTGSENKTISSEDTWQKTGAEESKTQEYFYFIKNPKYKPVVSAEAYLIGDLETGEIILEKNKNKLFPIASVSKLMTAIVSEKTQNIDKTVEISKEILSTEGGNGALHLSEQIRIRDLFYPLLLESSNDAAEAIASGSGRNTFIEDMNKISKSFGMASTSFADPSGLSEKNLSTVFDLFKFSEYLQKNEPEILKMTTEKSFHNSKKRVWFNNSQFLNLPGYLGGKRGYIDESKQTAVSLFSLPIDGSGERNLAIIVLRSSDRYRDVSNILKYINKNLYYGKEDEADLAWGKQKEGMPVEREPREPDFITLAFGGDIMLDRGVKSSVMKNLNGDYSELFKKLKILKETDISFANLEGTASDVGKDGGSLYSFRMDPSVVPALKGAGISVLSVANNHVGDWGRDAYKDTLKRLEENEILYTGGGINKEEASKPRIIEKYGMKIGFLGFSDVGPNFMQADEDSAGLLLASDPNFEEIIKTASQQVDYLIVSFHFGDEYKTIHNDRQEFLAHTAIDNGAKIVIGHHPHVMQDTEVYKGGFIAYSLGNFIFDQYFSEATMQGMLLEMNLNKNGEMTVTKNIVKLNSIFQPDKIIPGKTEKISVEKKTE
jgi:D-alanyl-D-alanine carboxypeptidase/poly-gamma-glutamate capsule biosynthesis protein CapA/YwtB (metallophosphatase superfamily)